MLRSPADAPPASRAGSSSAFERTLLPGFAKWLTARLQSTRPDVLIPAETKGARLLEAASDYARRELGTPIQVPILYRTALAYVEPDVLREGTAMLLDDARRSGGSLDRHRKRVQDWGVENVVEAVCIALNTGEESGSEDWFEVVEDDGLYREYVWQLTEMVCTGGLPPEVDHHVFEMRLPGPLAVVWGELEAALSQFGALGFDAPEREWGNVRGLTLHFPELPGVSRYPVEGPVRATGPNKVRLFPNEATGAVHVVPVHFPALELPAAARKELDVARTREMVRGWCGREGSVGELLAEAASRRDPEVVFRLLAATAEADLAAGLARVVGAAFGGEGVEIVPQREPFRRLYGAAVGERVAAQMETEVACALAGDGAAVELVADEPVAPFFLSAELVERTRDVAEGLQLLYEERSREENLAAGEPVGRSMPEIAARLQPVEAGDDPLMGSRCVDLGLAMTTLVPFVREEAGEASVRLERCYRVSEANRDFPFEDIATVHQKIGEELLAFCADYLGKHSVRFRNSPLPLQIATDLIAIMRPRLRQLELPLEVVPRQPNRVLALRCNPEIVGPREIESAFFVLSDADEVVPSVYFAELCEHDRLRIDRWQITERVEDFLDLMRPVLDSLPEDRRGAVLAGWAMSGDGHLGMTHVRAALRAILARAEPVLGRILRSEVHEPAVDLVGGATTIRECARSDLEILGGDWTSEAEECWGFVPKRAERLLDAAAQPDDRWLLSLSGALLDAAVTACHLTARLDEISGRVLRREEAPDDPERLAEVGRGCAAIWRALRSLEDAEVPAAREEETRGSIIRVGERLELAIANIDAFGSALVGEFRGPRKLREEAVGDNARERAILFMDLADSFRHSLEQPDDRDHAWKTGALGCAAQWGRAFGGAEPRIREGDAMWLEFEDVGAAILCGAAIQMHARDLRSTLPEHERWSLRMAVDFGTIRDGEGGNAIGKRLDRAAKLAKALTDPASTERVLVTPEAAKLESGPSCSAPVAVPYGERLELVETEAEGGSLEPLTVDARKAVGALSEHLKLTAARLEGELIGEEVPLNDRVELNQAPGEADEQAR